MQDLEVHALGQILDLQENLDMASSEIILRLSLGTHPHYVLVSFGTTCNIISA
jgi:pyridoxine 5'-phosphate synthase PdxJ